MTGEDLHDPGAFDAIAFDWGGVMTRGTFDSSAVVALAALIGTTPHAIEGAYMSLMEEFEVGAFDLEGFHARFSAATNSASDLDTFRSTFLGAVRERPAMYRLIGTLPAHYTVGVLSNNVPELCDTVRDDPRLARVETFVFSNEIGVRKPRTAAFEALAAALDVPPERTVFVDDNRDNIAACLALGFTGLLIDTPRAFAARWRATLPDAPLPEGFADDE